MQLLESQNAQVEIFEDKIFETTLLKKKEETIKWTVMNSSHSVAINRGVHPFISIILKIHLYFFLYVERIWELNIIIFKLRILGVFRLKWEKIIPKSVVIIIFHIVNIFLLLSFDNNRGFLRIWSFSRKSSILWLVCSLFNFSINLLLDKLFRVILGGISIS